MTYLPADGSQPFKDRLIQARDSPAVMKLKLTTLRSKLPSVTIVALEGDDDKIIYSQWIGRVRPSLTYESLVCRGKTGVLNLADVVARDKSGDGKRVYCFVDRDFDDLRGKSGYGHLFMTCTYSPENLLVSPKVLEALLSNEFHCDGSPDVRSRLAEVFSKTYGEFLKLAKDANFRLFVAKRLGIDIAKSLPDGLSFISTSLTAVKAEKVELADLIPFKVEPAQAETDQLMTEFDGLEPHLRYRGKWIFSFFEAWLRLLGKEHKERSEGLFEGIVSTSKARMAELVRSNFASRSDLPTGFSAFVLAMETAG